MKKEYSLTIKGFNTPEQVKTFIDWYEGQGEQDIPLWLECSEKLGVRYMDVDLRKKYQWNADKTNLTAWIEITPEKGQ